MKEEKRLEEINGSGKAAEEKETQSQPGGESKEEREEESKEEREEESKEEGKKDENEVKPVSSDEEKDEAGSEETVYVMEPDYDRVVTEALQRFEEADVADGFGETLRGALQTMISEANAGEISAETALLIALGLDYNRAVSQSRTEGETAGRNAQIEERLLGEMDTDGVPHPGCGQGAPIRGKVSSIFDLAREAL